MSEETKQSALHTFQKNVQSIVHEQEALKQYLKLCRETRKRIQTLSKDIMEYMESANIKTCRWGSIALTIDEKRRLPPLTAKSLAERVQTQFNIPQGEWEMFMNLVQQDRQENVSIVKSLAQKNADKIMAKETPKVIGPGIALPEPSLPKPKTMASSVDALYHA